MLAFMQPVQGDLTPFVRKDVDPQNAFKHVEHTLAFTTGLVDEGVGPV
jgi:hypothetical protein